ncbi:MULTISPECIES: ATPase domain-containing protein [Halanaerobium]|jgi:circadian clock protein KaiC|uniref:non-specific serine/threonine protein kinase n=1 Tax=Halanaerobium kushneri TaxID=56779 RepID=A0A1N6SJD7_9FIRM|nr:MULTISPECIES: ATPase domain-containing protein [Halanaerobium]RCW57337.1 circadian clock protein KaiC [Halanaerobium sp. ST460_2HS_T2]SIQ41228.1 circadian clock protein KaiC [Halanaerobium kushneri]
MNRGKRLLTGVEGLDLILNGGLIANKTYLLRGGPGTGKTTLGIHYLVEGVKNGEKSALITLTEDQNKLIDDFKSRNFSLDRISFIDLSPSSNLIENSKSYNVFPVEEVEKKPLINQIITSLNEINADRVYFDGLKQLRFLSKNEYEFRKYMLSMLQFAADNKITLLVSSEASKNEPDDDLQFLSDGVLNLNFADKNRRYINISKFRGSDFIKGQHSFKIKKKGLEVYPKLRLQKNKTDYPGEIISSGISEVDQLLHGGIESGTTTVISGASGVGKTTFGVQFMQSAAKTGKRSVIYTFEEDDRTLLKRSESVSIELDNLISNNKLEIIKVDPLEYTPGEFTQFLIKEAEENNTRNIMLDSVSGYKLSFASSSAGKNELIRNLHSLTNYLNNIGITVLLINEIANITGDFKVTELGISYLADNIMFLRYLEFNGELKKAIGVLKKRLSDFEKQLREFQICSQGIKVGKPLTELRGILTGNPEFINKELKESSKNGLK